jgi:deferrochelatase/peroxidase EfeB
MCLAVHGKVVKIQGEEVVVDYDTEKRTAKIIDKGYSMGDYVIVQENVINIFYSFYCFKNISLFHLFLFFLSESLFLF